jgi:hypothetical protein
MAWNFFDAILDRKEGYSDYVFEDKAAEYLKTNADLKAKYEAKVAADTAFANNPGARLRFIYENTAHAEPGHRRYPVYRIE